MNKCATVLAAVIGLLLGACQKTHTAHMDGMTMLEVTLDTMCAIGNGSDAPSCHVVLQMQYAEGTHAQKINTAILKSGILPPEYKTAGYTDIPTAAKNFAEQYIKRYRDANTPLYKYDPTHGKSYGQNFRLTVATHSRCRDILTYTATIVTQAGEQPETTQTVVRNIDTRSGHILSLDDIYIHGAEEYIKTVIVRKLAKRYGADGLEGLRSRQIFAENEVYVPDNFIVFQDKVIFIYQQGEIAPHDEGEIRITVSRSDIGKLMKQDIRETTNNNTL